MIKTIQNQKGGECLGLDNSTYEVLSFDIDYKVLNHYFIDRWQLFLGISDYQR